MDENTAVTKRHDPEKSYLSKSEKRCYFIKGFITCFILALIFFAYTNFKMLAVKDVYDNYENLDSNYGKYNEILRMIGEDPLAEKQPSAIDDEKLKELVASIGDPYAEYFTAEEYLEFEKHYKGEYVGIGITLTDEEGRIVIKGIFDGGPAQKAGIEVEDVIVKVDGAAPLNTSDAVSMITGEPGTEVEVTVKRGEEELTFKMNRSKIEYESVEYNVMDDYPGFGYIRITSFIEGTAKDFKLAVRDLQNEGCDKFIIDLRDNGGGLTSESIEIADYLLPACRIMSENTKSGEETVYNSKASSADIDFVMLTNGNTASASEILAGAVQDNKGGLIIGEKTFGKGVTQITRKFPDGSAVKLTVTEYFRPNGDTVNEKGIIPDIEASDEEALDAAIMELSK